MTKQTIAVDLDDVLALHAAAFIEFSNEHYGTDLRVEDYDDIWTNLWGDIGWDEIERRAAEFHTPESVLSYAKAEEAAPVLASLKENFRLVIVIARSKHLIDVTHEWLARHHVDVFEEVHFVPIWEPNNTVTKADICKQIGASYLIDDSVKHCNIAAQNGITALLLGNYKRGHKDVDSAVVKVVNWFDIQEYFNGIGRS